MCQANESDCIQEGISVECQMHTRQQSVIHSDQV